MMVAGRRLEEVVETECRNFRIEDAERIKQQLQRQSVEGRILIMVRATFQIQRQMEKGATKHRHGM